MFRRKPRIYSAADIHREYYEKLYRKLNKKLEKRARRGKIENETSLEELEKSIIVLSELKNPGGVYSDTAQKLIEKAEELLGEELSYQDKAAIIIRQAELEFGRPLRRQERGWVLFEEFKKKHAPDLRITYEMAAGISAEYRKHEYLEIDKHGNSKVGTGRETQPFAYVGGLPDPHGYIYEPGFQRFVFEKWIVNNRVSYKAEIPPGWSAQELEEMFKPYLKERARWERKEKEREREREEFFKKRLRRNK